MKKDSLVIAIGKMKPKGMKDEPEEHDEDSDSETDSGLEAAFDELVEAIKSEDSAAGVEALKSFITQCKSEGYDEEEKDDKESSSGF